MNPEATETKPPKSNRDYNRCFCNIDKLINIVIRPTSFTNGQHR